MAEKQLSYKKLPGRAAGFLFGRHQLWYSDDHLISVSSTYGSERYQRFYFREIGALVVRRTTTRLVWNLIFGVIAGLFIVPAVIAATLDLSPDSSFNQNLRAGVITVLILAAIALIGLIINTLKGASCSLWVQTAVGQTKLGAPVRVRAANKVIAILSPLIVKAQAGQPVSSPAAP